MTTAPPPPQSLTTVDAILSHYSKYLKPGESISIPLIKGKSTTTSIDPLLLKANGRITTGEKFPKLAKFIETVERPDFQSAFHGGRFYQENVPKVVRNVKVLHTFIFIYYI